MLEMILDKNILFVLMGIAAALGVISKIAANLSLKKLVRAAENMNKSNHPLMRLVKAKFEHVCMISDKVENVGVFVDKYLYEYKAAGIKLHSLRRLEKVFAGLCAVIGLGGAFAQYMVNGMQDMVIKTGAAGAGLGILVYLFHLTTDENYRMEAIKNYMVDYLENVCLHRYEKVYQKDVKAMSPEAPVPDLDIEKVLDLDKVLKDSDERNKVTADAGKQKQDDRDKAAEPNKEQEVIRPKPETEVPSPSTEPEIKEPAMPEPYKVPEVKRPVQAIERKKKEKEEPATKDVLIRQILEEFMA